MMGTNTISPSDKSTEMLAVNHDFVNFLGY